MAVGRMQFHRAAMKILYHHRTSGQEPESVHIASIVQALRKAGHQVDIVGPAPLGTSRSAGRRPRLVNLKEHMPRWMVETMQVVYNLRSFLQLRKVLKRTRYDFIYERYALYNVAGLLAARSARLPFILEVNTLYAQAWARYYGLTFPWLARRLEAATFRRSDHIITVTSVQRQMIEAEGVAPGRITVSHNAVDPGEFAPGCHEAGLLRQALNLKPVVVGFVGTMNRWQGVQGFVDVVAEVIAARQDISFLFVGEGERRAHLEAELDRRDLSRHVVFAGRQPHSQIARFIAAMSIGVLLDSNSYGSPMKVFEYWALAKPVVAPRVPPVLEIMQHEHNGLLIEPGDANGMARCILRLAADPGLREALGAAGRQQVCAAHTWDHNAAGIIAAFQECTHAAAGGSA